MSSNKSSSSSSSRFLAKMLSFFHATSEEAHQQQQQQTKQEEETALVIYVGGVGLDKESMMRYSVPWKYVSYPQFKKLVLLGEKSGGGGDDDHELKTIRSEGSVVIHCQVSEFEYVHKLVKAQERERVCKELSYDPRLWSGYWKESEAVAAAAAELINEKSSSRSQERRDTLLLEESMHDPSC